MLQTLVGWAPKYHIVGADGKTEVLATSSATMPTYNVRLPAISMAGAADNVGQVKRNGTTLTRFYYVKDHLGDTRVTVNSTGTADSWFDYYPYGQLLDGRCQTGSADPRYKYTGKERDAETGYDYFGARYYDSRIGRWLSVDPLAGKYPGWSPYAYATDNPMIFLDPNGKEVINRHYSHLSAFLAFLGVKQSPQYYETQKLLDQAKALDPQLYSRLDKSPSKVSVGVGSVEQDPSGRFRESETKVYNKDVNDNKASAVTITIDLDAIQTAAKLGVINPATNAEVNPESEPSLKVIHELGHAEEATTDYRSFKVSTEVLSREYERKAFEKIKNHRSNPDDNSQDEPER